MNLPAAWAPAPTTPRLPSGEVHVWRVALDVPAPRVAALASMLDPAEHARARHFRFDRHRDRWIAARGSLRAILAAYLQRAPAALRLGIGAHGKPCLIDGTEAAPLRFNLAHDDTLALVAVGWRREVGVDLERERPDRADLAVARRIFAPDEAVALAAMPLPLRCRAFFSLWTAREAYAKAVGRGLEAMADTPAPGWTVRHLAMGRDYAAAVAVEGAAEAVRCWTWQPGPPVLGV